MPQKSRENGQSFIMLVILIGSSIMVISLLVAFFTASFVDTGYGYQALAQAQAGANSGVEDALLQLDRNSSFSSAGYSVITTSSVATTVTVTQNSPTTGLITILSSATVSNHTRKITAIVGQNATTTQMNVISWQITQ